MHSLGSKRRTERETPGPSVPPAWQWHGMAGDNVLARPSFSPSWSKKSGRAPARAAAAAEMGPAADEERKGGSCEGGARDNAGSGPAGEYNKPNHWALNRGHAVRGAARAGGRGRPRARGRTRARAWASLGLSLSVCVCVRTEEWGFYVGVRDAYRLLCITDFVLAMCVCPTSSEQPDHQTSLF